MTRVHVVQRTVHEGGVTVQGVRYTHPDLGACEGLVVDVEVGPPFVAVVATGRLALTAATGRVYGDELSPASRG